MTTDVFVCGVALLLMISAVSYFSASGECLEALSDQRSSCGTLPPVFLTGFLNYTHCVPFIMSHPALLPQMQHSTLEAPFCCVSTRRFRTQEKFKWTIVFCISKCENVSAEWLICPKFQTNYCVVGKCVKRFFEFIPRTVWCWDWYLRVERERDIGEELLFTSTNDRRKSVEIVVSITNQQEWDSWERFSAHTFIAFVSPFLPLHWAISQQFFLQLCCGMIRHFSRSFLLWTIETFMPVIPLFMQ